MVVWSSDRYFDDADVSCGGGAHGGGDGDVNCGGDFNLWWRRC